MSAHHHPSAFHPLPHRLALALALIYPVLPALAQAQAQAQASAAPPAAGASAPVQRVEVAAQRQQLDAARNGLSPDTGSSVFRFDRQDLQNLPLGDATPLNQVILQAPGVVQDSYGQLHVRGDHGNLQYRLDGVLLPEAISGFGQALETRLADQVRVLTGALPAQYGQRTAGVVDIRSKGEVSDPGGHLSLSGGSQGQREASLELAGNQGAFSWYLMGTAMRSNAGIENPQPTRSPLHDQTRQGNGFAYISYLATPKTRVSLMLGASANRFQIPDVPGQTPGYTLNGRTALDSSTLDARQKEHNQFGVLSVQSSLGEDIDYQLALFRRWTDTHYTPDAAGDLMFNGVAADVRRGNAATGIQADGSWRLNAQHTVRAGLMLQGEQGSTANHARVFPADAAGNATSDQPFAIQDDSRLRGHLFGAYLQDAWTPFKSLTINYGLRYDQVHTVVDEHQLSPRLGLVQDLGGDLRLHAGYARYFTPPPTEKIDGTSVQKFLGTTNALPSDANTAVRSERSNYLDLGLEQGLGAHLTVGVDAYVRDVRHLQDEGQFGNALIYSAFNFARGRIRGLELTANWRDGAWSAYANMAWSRAFGQGIETGQFNFGDDELAYIGRHWVHLDHDQARTASAGLTWTAPDHTRLTGDVLMGSGLRNGFANTGKLPGYAQVNAAVTRPFQLGAGLGTMDVRLSVANLFDRVYALRDGSGIGVGAPQFAPRRGVMLGLDKAF